MIVGCGAAFTGEGRAGGGTVAEAGAAGTRGAWGEAAEAPIGTGEAVAAGWVGALAGMSYFCTWSR